MYEIVLLHLGIRSCGRVSIGVSAPNWVLVAHTCDPSYSGGREQEDFGWKPAQANRETLS
jgi:hypothetical protein